jgi:hypothetical protein
MTGRRSTARIYARYWIVRPLYRLLGIQSPTDFRVFEYQALRHHS